MSKKLYFRYGAMDCGKTTRILQVAHNYEEKGQAVIIAKPAIDTKGGDYISSRLGIGRSVDWLLDAHECVLSRLDQLPHRQKLACILVDEAQFLTRSQVNGFFRIVVERDIPVICYGLRADFQTRAFPGSMRLMELAHIIEEIETVCRCGSRALFNARKLNGHFVSEGAQVAIDGQGEVTYESLCGACYLKLVGPLAA